MTVNGNDTLNYNARLLSRTIGLGTVTVYDDWLKNASNPLYFGDQVTYKQIKLSFLIKDNDDNSAFRDISNLVAQLKKCTIKFDDMDFLYDCVIQEAGEPTKSISDGRFKLDVTLKAAYAYLPEVSQTYDLTFSSSKDDSVDLNVQGNIPTPISVDIKVVSSPDSDTLNFKFNVDPNANTTEWIKNGFILRSIELGDTATVDSEKYLVYEALTFIPINVFGHLWGDFVSLQPGANTIPVGLEALDNTAEIELTIRYKPRFI